MAKKDKTDRKSFEDMSAKREAEVKASLEAASDRMADAQGEAMLANINRRTDEAKGERERVMKTAVNIGAPQASLGIGREDIQGNAGSTFKRGMNKSRFNVHEDLSEKADVARQEAVSDRIADAQGEAMLANIGRRIDEVKGEEERKRNYHLLQQAAIRENENSRVKNTSVNVGVPQAPLNFEPEEISDNADRTFKRGMNKNQYGVRQDFSKRALAAEAEAAIAASDRMADAQSDAMTENIKNLIAKRESDAAEREAAEQRKAKYLSDQQAAIRANQKQTEKPAVPASNEPGNSSKTEAQENTDERIEVGRATRTEAQGNAEAQGKAEVSRNTEADTDVRVDAGKETRTEEQRGNASNKPAGKSAPFVVHNAEERFQKNLEDVQGKLKYEPVLEIIRKYQEEQQRLADNRTPEQKKKAARREKVAKIIAALGDGVAAMSNLVLTSKGAIPYQSKSMISRAVSDRYDKFSKDLENRRARYLELSEKIAKLQQGVEDGKAADERMKEERKRKEGQDKMNKELHRLKMAGLELDNKHTQAQIQKIKDDDAYREKALQVKKAIAELNAMSREKAARIRGSYGGRGRTTYTTPWDGKTYSNLAEYKAAVDEAAILYDVQDYKTVNYQSGFKTNQRVMPKSTSQKAAEITQKSKEARGGKWGFSIHKK